MDEYYKLLQKQLHDCQERGLVWNQKVIDLENEVKWHLMFIDGVLDRLKGDTDTNSRMEIIKDIERYLKDGGERG